MRRLFLTDQVIDGTGAAPIAGGAVLAEGDRILACGRAADIGRPDGVTVFKAPPGSTLMPGLIDVHVHLAYSGITHKRAFRTELADLSYPAIALRAAAYARDTLKAGFTSVRDMHAPGGTIIDLRDAIDKGEVVGPRIKACGRGLSVTGGHMDQPGWADHAAFRDLTSACDGPTAFRRGAREEIKRGADFVKLNTCVSAWHDPERPWRKEMTDEEIEAACDEAHAHGLPVAAHTSGGPGIAASVLNGVDCIEHGHWLDEKTVDLMADRGTFYVPTLAVNERNFDFEREELGVSDKGWRWLTAARDAKWTSLERARRAGVRIASGTDAGFMLPHGIMNWRELALLAQGGLSPMQAIVAATATGADLIGVEAGRLAPGRLADLLVVAGDPLTDIGLLGDPRRLTVFKGGREIA